MRNKFKFILCAWLALSITSFGYAQWNFSNKSSVHSPVIIVLDHFQFKNTWTNSDILPEDSYEAVTDFEYAMNNPNSEEGKAWQNIVNNMRGNGNNSYVGSMDSRAVITDNTVIISDSDASYIIKRRNNNEYDIYTTYEALDRATGTVQPVYKTKMKRVDASSNFEAVESWVGKCDRNRYYLTQLTTYSFDTESFTEI